MKVGSLFTGYGGLDLAVESVFDATTVWTSDIDPGARKVIAHRFPEAPNLGDIRVIDWSRVEPVDILTGGSPCQDLSQAGKRAGMTDGTRSNLWALMREGIRVLQPELVIWENVRGALTARADSALELEPGRVGDRTQPPLRALGRVLGDLAELGYDACWHGLYASDVGAPHPRFRVFVAATRLATDSDHLGWEEQGWASPVRPEHGAAECLGDPARWGPYAAAIARWEKVCGRAAPEATEEDRSGRRLSARFVEWMMGLPDGWVTDVPDLAEQPSLFAEAPGPDLRRTAALRLLGNGVVPQQAAAALALTLT